MRSHDFLSKIFMLHRVCTLWKLRKFTLTEKIFRQITYLVISLVKLLLSRNFCQKSMRVYLRNFHTVQHRFSMFLFLFTEISTRCPSLIRGQSGFSSDSCLQIGSIGPLFSKCTSFMLETSPFWFARGYSDKFAQIVLHLDGYFTHWGQRYPTSFHTKWKVSG